MYASLPFSFAGGIWDVGFYCIIAGPLLLPDKAKFTVCSLIKIPTIAFDETSSYWSAPKSS